MTDQTKPAVLTEEEITFREKSLRMLPTLWETRALATIRHQQARITELGAALREIAEGGLRGPPFDHPDPVYANGWNDGHAETCRDAEAIAHKALKK